MGAAQPQLALKGKGDSDRVLLTLQVVTLQASSSCSGALNPKQVRAVLLPLCFQAGALGVMAALPVRLLSAQACEKVLNNEKG